MRSVLSSFDNGKNAENRDVKSHLSEAAIAELEGKLGYTFSDKAVLKLALLHSSATAQHLNSNERLEFLGDGILSFVVADILFRRFPNSSEGVLTQFRAQLVSTQGLYEVGTELGLADYMHFGDSFADKKPSKRMIANCFEALMAAIYQDGGISAVYSVIELHLANRPVGSIEQKAEPLNYKSLLQQWTQCIGPELPSYFVVGENGPEHRKTYSVAVEYAGMRFKCGVGSTKKEAEQNAAYNAWRELVELAGEKP